MRRRWRGLILVAAAVAPAVALAQPVTALGATPSLRLFQVGPRATVPQPELRAGFVDLGLWITPIGGSFQVDVTRPGYGAWETSQVDAATGAALRSVPASLVDPRRGFRRFLSIRFLDSGGHSVAHRLLTFCPNGESARTSDSGPATASYPEGCSAVGFSPFVRGMVWGIDAGWAVSPAVGFFFPGGKQPVPVGRVPAKRAPGGFQLARGRYTAIASITRPYRALFGIPADQSSATIRVHVVRGRRPPGLPPDVRAARAHRLPHPRAAASVAEPDAATIPNLVGLPAWGIRVRHAGHRDLLTFDATIWNAGPAPFSIEGYRRPDSDVMDAYEYFFDSSGNVVGRAPAGTLFYDTGHGHHHWHLRQLADYRLLSPSGSAVRSHKQSFCIAPTDPIDLTLPTAEHAPEAFLGLGFGGSACDFESPHAIWIREQLPVGWGDTYNQSVAGQAFDVTNMPNGRYRIAVRVNPLGVLTETTTADDVAIRHIRLSGRPGARKVTVAPWHGIHR